ncbi:MAG: hypothetical protein ACOYL3_09720 [Desulfuromonadaceae bacterium]
MRALAETIEKIPIGGRIRDWLDEDYVRVCGHDGNTLALDFTDDDWEWF